MENGEQVTYRVDWQEVRRDWPAWLILLASLVASAILYPRLPEQIPIHWNIEGQVDDYAGRFWGAFGLPLLNVGTYLLLLFLPLVDPKRANYARFIGFYRGFRVFMTLFLAGLHGMTLYAALGKPVDVALPVNLGVSALFVYLGNSLGRVRHNYFVGIKTPWTLANEEVWRRTHRLAVGSSSWPVSCPGSPGPSPERRSSIPSSEVSCWWPSAPPSTQLCSTTVSTPGKPG